MATPNPFDQFDSAQPAQAQASANPFDQFDSHSTDLPTVTVSPTADDYRTAGRSVPANLRTSDETGFQKFLDFGNDLGDSTLHHLGNLPVGAAQLLGHGVTAAADAMSGAPQQNMSGLITGDSPQRTGLAGMLDRTSANFDQFAKQREATYQQNVPTNLASTLGAGIGEAIPYAFGGGELKAAGMLPEASSAIGKIGLGSLQGGAIAAVQPVAGDSGSFAANKAKQIGAGLAIGGAVPAIAGIPRGIVGSVDPELQSLARKANQYGIDITAPQVSKSVPMKVANSVTSQFPFSGAQAFAAKQSGQFNNAIAQEIGLPAGTTKITHDVFNNAYEKASNGFNTLWSGNSLPVGGTLLSKIVPIANEASSYGAADSAGDALNATINRLVTVANQNGGSVPGRAFQNIDTLLGNTVKNGGTAGHYAGEMQDALRNAMQDNMSPADASQLQTLRQQWQNLRQLAPIVAKQTDGNIPPSALMGAITNNGAGKNAMARGIRGSMGDLAQIGKGLLGNTYQDSGSAARVAAYDTMKTLGGVAAGAGTGTLAPLAGAVVGARATQSALRSKLLYNALMGQSQQASSIGRNALTGIPVPLAVGYQAPQFQIPQNQQMPINALSGVR